MQISLGRALHLWKLEANKWILNKKTAQAIQLLLISPPCPLGSTLQLGVYSEGLGEGGSRGPGRAAGVV